MQYGYQSAEELAPGKQGGVFGKNTGYVVKFEYNPNGGADGAAQDCIDFTAQVGEFEYRKRYFPISKVFKADGSGEITDTNSDEYKEEYDKAVKNLNATLSDIVGSFVDEETLKNALSVQIGSFRDFAQILEGLVKSNPGWDKKPVDIFLQYQWQPRGDKDRTYPEIPAEKSIKHGAWICASKGPGFKEVRTDTSLRYVNDAGEDHPFTRGKWFVESPFANQTIISGGAISGNQAVGESATW